MMQYNAAFLTEIIKLIKEGKQFEKLY